MDWRISIRKVIRYNDYKVTAALRFNGSTIQRFNRGEAVTLPASAKLRARRELSERLLRAGDFGSLPAKLRWSHQNGPISSGAAPSDARRTQAPRRYREHRSAHKNLCCRRR